MRRVFVGLVSALVGLSAESAAQAQDLEVYGWETVDKGSPELTLWTTYIPRSDVPYRGGTDPVGAPPAPAGAMNRSGTWLHALELEYGVTPQLTLAMYVDGEDPPYGRFQYTGVRFEARYRLGLQRYTYFVDPAVYVEYTIPKTSYADEELEGRIILEKFVWDVAFRLNAIVQKGTSGQSVSEGTSLGYAAGIYYRRLQAVQPGLEAFGSMGSIGAFEPLAKEKHTFFLTVQIQLFNSITWQLGGGYGVGEAADRWTVKSILAYGPPSTIALGTPAATAVVGAAP